MTTEKKESCNMEPLENDTDPALRPSTLVIIKFQQGKIGVIHRLMLLIVAALPPASSTSELAIAATNELFNSPCYLHASYGNGDIDLRT